MMRERLAMAQDEVIECTSSNPLAVTSVCIRLQLWRASLLSLRENLLLGSGSTANFPNTLKVLAEQNLISQYAANEFGEPHSEIMQSLSAFGLLGLLSLMLIYLAPALMFLKRLRSSADQPERVAAAMGLALCTGFIIFGLTELMFRNMHVIGYYAALNAWLLAISDPNHKFLSARQQVYIAA
jgi:O-antigen ligase